MKKILVVLAIVALTLSAAAYQVSYYSGGGHSGYIKWNPSYLPCDYKMNSAGTPDCSGEIVQLQNSLDEWTDVTNCSFEYDWDGTTSDDDTHYNGTNLLYWAEVYGEFPYYPINYIAVNTFWFNWNSGVGWWYATESDVCFNGLDYLWSDNGQGGRMDVANIATHELGHTLSLADLYSGADSEKTMYGYASAGETKKRTLHTDDIAGIRYLFPGGSDADGEDDPSTPEAFSLYPAYPNPSSGSVTVAFSVPHTASLELDLYDIKGRKIETLASGEYSTGEYEAKVDGLSGGIYLYRLTSGSFAETKKMVVR